MAKLKGYESSNPRTKQEGHFWCIPASYEWVLRFAELSVTQEDMVLEYCRRAGGTAVCCGVIQVPIPVRVYAGIAELPSDVERIHVAQLFPLAQANLGVFKEIAVSLCGAELIKERLQLRHENPSSLAPLVSELNEALSKGYPSIVCLKLPSGAHIVPVIEINSNVLRYWDVADGVEKDVEISDDKLNTEFVILEDN